MPEDFEEIQQLTDRCLAILNVNEERKEHPWSFDYEVIP
jgi:hypothetical protein